LRLRGQIRSATQEDHQIDLATALGEDAPDLSGGKK